MEHATIVFHMPAHREASVKIQGDTRETEQAYDEVIHDYLAFLEQEAGKVGLELRHDQRAGGPVYSIDAPSHDAKKAAHDWLETQPDLWNWMP